MTTGDDIYDDINSSVPNSPNTDLGDLFFNDITSGNRGDIGKYETSVRPTGSRHVGIDISEYEDYFEQGRVFLNEGLDRTRAMRQGAGEQAFRAVAGTALNLVPRIVGDIAAIVDLEDYRNVDNEVGNFVTEFTNSMIDYVNQDLLPIYRENPGRAFDWGDSGYWFDNGRMLASSVIPFIVEGYLTGGAAAAGWKALAQGSKFARAMATGANVNKATRFAKFLNPTEAGAVQGLAGLTSAAMLNQAESIGSAMGVFDETYRQLMEQGLTEEEARSRAADAAAYTVSMNRVNLLLNMSSASMFVKAPWSTRALIDNPSLKNTFKKLAYEGAQEYVEETINYVSEKAGTARGLDKDMSLSDMFKEAISEHGIEAGVLGAIGGITQTAGTVGTKNLAIKRLGLGEQTETGWVSATEAQRGAYNRQQELIQALETVFDDPSTLPRVTNTFSSIETLYRDAEDLKKAIASGDQKRIDEIQNRTLTGQALAHFEQGTTEKLIEFYKRIEEGEASPGMDNDPTSDSYYKKRAREAQDAIKKLEKEYVNSRNFRNGREVYANRAQKIFKNMEINSIRADMGNVVADVEDRIQSRAERYNLLEYSSKEAQDIVSLAYDINNLREYPTDTEARRAYSKFFNNITKDPTVVKYLGMQDAIESIRNEIRTLEDNYDDMTSLEEQEKLKKRDDNVVKEIKNLVKQQAKAKRKETTVANNTSLANDINNKQPSNPTTAPATSTTVPPVTPPRPESTPIGPPEEVGPTDPTITSSGRKMLGLSDKIEVGTGDLSVTETKQAVSQIESETAQIAVTPAEVFTPTDEALIEDMEAEIIKDTLKDPMHISDVRDEVEYDYRRSTSAHNKVAHKDRDFVELTFIDDKGFTTVNRQDLNDKISQALMSTKLLDYEKLLPGQTITLRAVFDDDQEIPMDGRLVRYGDLTDIQKIEKAPIVIEYEGDRIGYLHDPSWINPTNVSGNLNEELTKLQNIRRLVLQGPVSTTITKVSNGTLLKRADGEYLPTIEAFPDNKLDIAISQGGELKISRLQTKNSEFQDKYKVLNSNMFNGWLWAVLPVGMDGDKTKAIATPLKINKVPTDIKDSIVAAVRVFTYQTDQGPEGDNARLLRDEFETRYGLNLFEINDLRTYLSLFLYADFRAERNVKLIDYLKRPDVSSDLRMINITPTGIEWGRGRFKGDNLRNLSANTINSTQGREFAERMLHELGNHISEMYLQANLGYLTEEDFIVPIITSEGIVDKFRGPYKNWLKQNTTTNLFSVDIGNKYAYTIQRTIEFDTNFVPSTRNPLFSQPIVPASDPVITKEQKDNLPFNKMDIITEPVLPTHITDEGILVNVQDKEVVTPDLELGITYIKDRDGNLKQVTPIDTLDQSINIPTTPSQENAVQEQAQEGKPEVSKPVTLKRSGRTITVRKSKPGNESHDLPADNAAIQAIQDEVYSTLLIPGLTTARQQTIIDNVALDINASVIEKGGISIREVFEQWREDFEGLREAHDEVGNTIQAKDIGSILDNWDMFKNLTMNYLSQFSTLRITENMEDDVSENEEGGDLSRSNFDDDGSLQVNGKDTISAKLKKLMANIKEIDSDGNVVPNYIDLDKYVPFDTVYNTISAKLGGEGASFARADFDQMMKILEQSSKDIPFLLDVVEKFRAADRQIQNEFVVAMAKHYVRMKTVLWSYGDSGYDMRVIDTNRNSIAQAIINGWNNNIQDSDLFIEEDGNLVINREVGESMLELYNSWLDSSADIPIEEIADWLGLIGIDIPLERVSDLYTYGLYVNNKRQARRALLDNKLGLIGIIANKIKTHLLGEGITLSDLNPLDDSSIDALAKQESRFAKNVLSNSHRDGEGKTIYSFTQNKYAINRFRDLMTDKNLLDKLSQVPFIKHSTWLKDLREGGVMSDVHEITYMDTIRRSDRKGKGKKLKDMSKAEHELTKLAFLQNKGRSREGDAGKKIRIGRLMYPTMSDKTTMLVVQAVLHNTRLLSSGELSPETVNAVYESLVLPEIERILSQQLDPITNVKGYDKGAGIFYMIPDMNNLEEIWETIMIGDTETRQLKTDVLVSHVTTIKDTVKAFLEEVIDDKVNEWRDMGINNDSRKFMDAQYLKGINKSNTIRHAAADYVINYMIGNANIFQLYIGDPAQFYKKEKDTPSNDYVGVVADTFINIGKRLAGDIAPGYEIAGSVTDTYRQAFLSDRESQSVAMEYYKTILDDYSPYESIEGTDAQEFTTWAEHLDVMFMAGKITDKDYNTIKDKLLHDKPLDDHELDIVMQPMKPVYVNNIIEYNKNGAPIMERRMYIKSSSFPLIPQLTSGLDIDKLRVAMEKEHIDRVAFGTAVKVGNFNNTPQFFEEKDGTYFGKEDFSFGEAVKVLPRSGFRIQQEVPYDNTKDKVNDGTQQRKLLFANLLQIGNFFYKGETLTGAELKEKYDSIYENLFKRNLEQLYERIGVVDGKPDIAAVQRILVNEAISRNYPINDIAALELGEDGQFKIPLWASSSADKFESLLNSLVDNEVRKLKHRGNSFVLGTEEGFKMLEGEEGQAYINSTNKILFTSSWTGELKPQRRVSKSALAKGVEEIVDKNHPLEDVVVLPAQVMIPMKLRDQDGKIINLSKFVVDNKLDMSKIDPDVFKLFGFRIPTQGLNSMSYMEVVGFLPDSQGDLLIAPRDFTKQMGSDFDIDKLYTYMYNTYMEAGKIKIYKRENFKNVEHRLEELKKALKRLREENKEINELLRGELFKDAMVLINQGREDELTDNQVDLLRQAEEALESKPNVRKKLRGIMRDISRLSKAKSGKVFDQNELLDIHFAVLSNPDIAVQQQIAKPLDFGDLKKDDGTGLAARIDNIRRNHSGRFNPLGPTYQRDKFMNATAGKAGVGNFSNDSTFNALIQDKDLVLGKTVYKGEEPVFMPVKIKFGEDISNGNLSNALTLRSTRKNLRKYKSDVIAAYQSAAVDNEKEQILDKLNINSYTFDVIKVLNQLGFEEDTVSAFICQDIIFDYVDELVRLKDSTNDVRVSNPERTAYINVYNKYKILGKLTDIENISHLADVGPDVLMRKIEEGGAADPLTQLAILDKFMMLSDYGIRLKRIQSAINTDSAGIGKSLLYSVTKEEQVASLINNKNVKNAHKLIGDYSDVAKEGYYPVQSPGGPVYIKPNGISGYASIYALTTNNALWKDMFPYNTLGVSEQFKEIEQLLDQDMTLSQKAEFRAELWKDMKSFIYTDLSLGLYSTNNLQQRRQELFFDKFETETIQGDGVVYKRQVNVSPSLATRVKQAVGKREFAANAFLNKLTININKSGASLITFTASSGENYDERNVYVSFAELIVNEREIEPGYTSRMLAGDLIEYAFLEGGIQEAIQFVKYVPASYLKNIPFANRLLNYRFDAMSIFGGSSNKYFYYDTGRFTDQYIQHNSYRVQGIDNKAIENLFYSKPLTSSQFKTTTTLRPKSGEQWNPYLVANRILGGELISEAYPEYFTINHKDGIMLFKLDADNYVRLDTLGTFGMSEYDFNTSRAYTNLLRQAANRVVNTTDEALPQLDNTPVVTNSERITSEYEVALRTSVINGLEYIQENTLDSNHKSLANFIKANIGHVNIVFADGIAKRGNTSFKDGEFTVTLYPEAHSNTQEFEKTILHEFMHVLTKRAIDNNPELAKRLEKVIEQALKSMPGEREKEIRRLIQDRKKSELYKAGLYGLYDKHELIAEAFTNPEFQTFLKSVPLEDGTVWSNIFRQIKSAFEAIFGAVPEPDALSTVFEITEQLIRPRNSLFSKMTPGAINTIPFDDVGDLPIFKKDIDPSKLRSFMNDRNIC